MVPIKFSGSLLFKGQFFNAPFFYSDSLHTMPLEMLKKANPKKLIELWKLYVTDKYQKEIEAGDYNFFTNKDYSIELDEQTKNDNEVMNSIEKFKAYTQKLNNKNLETSMTYIKNLSTLCILYYTQ